jgi:hypothetical protein
MGVVRSMQKNKIGKVVVSVFDWYREYTTGYIAAEELTISCPLPTRRAQAASEA